MSEEYTTPCGGGDELPDDMAGEEVGPEHDLVPENFDPEPDDDEAGEQR